MKHLKITHEQTSQFTSQALMYKNHIHYEQGIEAANIQFSLICKNLPIGTVVGFKSDTPGPQPPILLPPTTVISSPSFITGMISFVPANYSCDITYYAEFNKQPPSDASITLQAAYIING
jgi:hypothetical protein